jgi:hypothetical protein
MYSKYYCKKTIHQYIGHEKFIFTQGIWYDGYLDISGDVIIHPSGRIGAHNSNTLAPISEYFHTIAEHREYEIDI